MKNFTKFLEKIIDFGMTSSLALLSSIISLQVFSRYLFSIPLPWSTDVNRFLFVYLIFLGAAAGVREKAHLNIDFLIQKFPKKVKVIWEIGINIIMILFLTALVYGGTRFTIDTFHQVTPYLRVSISYFYMVIPFSAIVMIYYLIFQTRDQVRNNIETNGIIEKEKLGAK